MKVVKRADRSEGLESEFHRLLIARELPGLCRPSEKWPKNRAAGEFAGRLRRGVAFPAAAEHAGEFTSALEACLGRGLFRDAEGLAAVAWKATSVRSRPGRREGDELATGEPRLGSAEGEARSTDQPVTGRRPRGHACVTPGVPPAPREKRSLALG